MDEGKSSFRDVAGRFGGHPGDRFAAQARRTWTTLYWHWPVEVLGRTRYHRIALLIPHDVNARLVAPTRPSRPEMQNDLERILDRPGADDEGPTVAAERDVLVAFGNEMVEASVARAGKGPT